MDCLNFILQITLLAAVVQSGEGIRCYLCNSAVNSKCSDPFTPDSSMQTVECSPDSLKYASNAMSSLRNTLKVFGIDTPDVFKGLGIDTNKLFEVPDFSKAICQKVDIRTQDFKQTTTIRTCSMPKSSDLDTCANFRKFWDGSDDVKVTYCGLCDEAGCNGAAGVLPKIFIVVLLSALVLCLRF
uniref:Uncharacterized protein n=1 Tax=Clastoptera arizonana TaxID=38151 RepID=A0A1B6DUG0_9HEMI